MSFLERFSSLQWKLVFSYVVVTVLTVLVLQIVLVVGMDWLNAQMGEEWGTEIALAHAERLAEAVAAPLAAGAPDQVSQALRQPLVDKFLFTVRLEDHSQEGEGNYDNDVRVVIDARGQIVASDQPDRYVAQMPFVELGWPERERLVKQTLADGVATTHLMEDQGVVVAIAPIYRLDGTLSGALYYVLYKGDLEGTDVAIGSQLLGTLLLLLPCTIPLGLIFGFVTSAGLRRRLRRLAQASDALAAGDLSRRVADGSGDEIGQLARQFNVMAAQIEADTARLHALAQQTQRLAALEERHRLARDLHDGVKQYLFGVNLAVSAALNQLDENPETARAKLMDAKELSRRAQAEMQALLNELRPAGLDQHGLVVALSNHLDTFRQREEIHVAWYPADDLSLPLTHEQVLFRVAQEALTNVARHAEANRVTVELSATANTVTLQVADDGKGFDPQEAQTGSTMGLKGMRERLTALDRTLTVVSSPGAGTQLIASLPRPADPEDVDPQEGVRDV